MIKLENLDKWNGMRRANAEHYRSLLEDVTGLLLPVETAGAHHVYNQFTVMTEQRDGLKEHLAGRGIGSMVYYSENLHRQPIFAGLGHSEGDFPVAEGVCRRVLSLPVYPGLSPEQVEYVAGAVRDYFGAPPR